MLDMGLLSLVLATIAISASGAIVPGPMTAIAIAKAREERFSGSFIALGHSLVEFPLVFLLYFGFSAFFTNATVITTVGILGGLILLFFGADMVRSRNKFASGEKSIKFGNFSGGIITSITNPYFFLWWATIGLALLIRFSVFGLLGVSLFAISHWIVDFIWTTFLTYSVNRSKHLWTKRTHEYVFGGCGLLLIIFGLWFILSSI